MFFKRNKRLFTLILIILSLTLAACGNNNGNDNTSEGTNPDETITMTDPLGHEIAVPANPKRVIASYLEDHLITLGVTPVAQWSVSNGTQAYLQSYLTDVPTVPHDLPFEVVASYEPDLLIVGNDALVEGGKYEQYAQIAPTYVLGDEVTGDWRQSLLKIGEVLQLSDKAQEALDAYDQKAAEAKETIQQSVGNQSVAAIWLVAKQFYVVRDDVSSGAVLYQDLGLTVPDVVKEVSESGTGNWNPISLEKLAELDVDHLFLVNSDGDQAKVLLEDPLWQGIPAVKNGNVYEYPRESSWLYSGVIANSQIIDDVLENLVP